MTLRVVGAGLGRTGTHSLKVALEQLLGEPCYHMVEVFGHPEHVPAWQQAMDTGTTDWDALFDGYVASVDWPGAAFWQPIAEQYPDALILLSWRDADGWWKSACDTIIESTRRTGEVPEMADWHRMVSGLLEPFSDDHDDGARAKALFEAHNADVRASVPAERLIDWRTGDGWEPICTRLGLPVPAEPFPVTNTTAEFREMAQLDEPA
jgi:hypothetical protein